MMSCFCGEVIVIKKVYFAWRISYLVRAVALRRPHVHRLALQVELAEADVATKFYAVFEIILCEIVMPFSPFCAVPSSVGKVRVYNLASARAGLQAALMENSKHKQIIGDKCYVEWLIKKGGKARHAATQ